MALSIDSKYKRHTKQCSKGYGVKDFDRDHNSCDCNYSVAAEFRLQMLNGEIVPAFVRKTTGESDKDKANAVIRAAMKRGYWVDVIEEKRRIAQPDGPPKLRGGHLITDLANAYSNKRIGSTTKVDHATQTNYKAMMSTFEEWCATKNLTFAEQLDETLFETFVDDMPKPFGERKKGLKPNTIGNYVTHLKGFGSFGVREGCFKYNYAENLKPPKGKRIPREGFSDEKMQEIYDAAMKVTNGRPGEVTGFEVRTFIKMMRCAAMAIVDASLMNDGAIVDGRLAPKALNAAPVYGDELQYFRTKTDDQENRVWVHIPLEMDLLEDLAELRRRGLHTHGEHGYYFSRNSVDKDVAPKVWRGYLTPIFKAVGIEGCPTHRFRHSFAKEMILKWIEEKRDDGRIIMRQIPISRIALWMGHADEKTTIKHYNATIKARDQGGSEMMRLVHAQRKTAA
jgi:integrase